MYIICAENGSLIKISVHCQNIIGAEWKKGAFGQHRKRTNTRSIWKAKKEKNVTKIVFSFEFGVEFYMNWIECNDDDAETRYTHYIHELDILRLVFPFYFIIYFGYT